MIREIRTEDYNDIFELLYELSPTETVSKKNLKGIIHKLSSCSNTKIIGFEKNLSMVGICIIHKVSGLSYNGRPFGIIESVVVRTEHRNNKIGEKIVKAAIKTAKDWNCYKVILETGSKQGWKHQFYEKCGLTKGQKTAFIKRFKE